jgi:hypothetical protein
MVNHSARSAPWRERIPPVGIAFITKAVHLEISTNAFLTKPGSTLIIPLAAIKTRQNPVIWREWPRHAASALNRRNGWCGDANPHLFVAAAANP